MSYDCSVSILALEELDLFGGYVDLLGVLLLSWYLYLKAERWVKVVGVVVGCEADAGADEKQVPKAPKKDSMMSQAASPTRPSGL